MHIRIIIIYVHIIIHMHIIIFTSIIESTVKKPTRDGVCIEIGIIDR